MDKFESSVRNWRDRHVFGRREKEEREREREGPRVSYADAEMMHRGPS